MVGGVARPASSLWCLLPHPASPVGSGRNVGEKIKLDGHKAWDARDALVNMVLQQPLNHTNLLI